MQLLGAVAWGRAALASLHAQESLAGALLGADVSGAAGATGGTTAAGEALAVLAEGRTRGIDDARLMAEHPVLLVLLPPSLAGAGALPRRTGWTGAPHGVAALSVREGLRLRIRWVQEMQASMVRECATRMAAAGQEAPLERLAALRWAELVEALDGAGPPSDLARRAARPPTPPLPSAFRLGADGTPVAERLGRGARGAGDGQGAGGGYGAGVSWHGAGARPERAVLVVRALDPRLAPELPGLAGLVAETGSVLSHLAVLAREHRVPTAVDVPDALERFPPGTELTVDGASGVVRAPGPAQTAGAT